MAIIVIFRLGNERRIRGQGTEGESRDVDEKGYFNLCFKKVSVDNYQ